MLRSKKKLHLYTLMRVLSEEEEKWNKSKNLAKVTLVAEIIFMVMLSVSFLIMPFAKQNVAQ